MPIPGSKNDTVEPLRNARVAPSGDHDGIDESVKVAMTDPVAGLSTTSAG